MLLALAFLAVIAVSVAATVWVTHKSADGSESGSQASDSSSGEIASANDIGPIGIITEDPTCGRWLQLADDVFAKLADWAKRDPAIPASDWTAEQRRMYEAAGRVLRAQADQTVQLAKDTPHRVMRELYEQQIAYSRAYADAISNYKPADNQLARVGNALAGALSRVCNAIANLSAAEHAPLVPAAAPPTLIAPVGNPDNPQRFLTAPSPVCPRLQSQFESDDSELAAWYKVPNVPADERSMADKILWDAAARVLARGAAQSESVGRASGNPVMEDFLVLSAQYYRAFVSAFATYTVQDGKLGDAAQQSGAAVLAACNSLPR